MVSMSYRDPVTGELKPIPLGGLPGMEVGDTPPTDENIEFYIDPDGTPVPPTLDELDDRYVNSDGDTMTGELGLGNVLRFSTSPSQIGMPQAANLEIWSGGGLGNVVIADPVATNQAATKGYVDNKVTAGMRIESGFRYCYAGGPSAVSFSRPFAAIPNVIVGWGQDWAGAANIQPIDISTVGFNMAARNHSTGSFIDTSGFWIAMGPA